MEILYFLESIRMPWLNEAMLLITKLGEELAFLVLTMIVFWCINKRRGYYIMAVCFIGSMFSLFFKMVFQMPRPWVRNPDFSIVEQAREAAEGYSFPSAHTQIAAGTFGAMAYTAKRRAWCVLFVVLAVLVGISRMYLGVHAPEDVIVGAVIAVTMVLLLKPMADRWEHRSMVAAFLAMLLLGLGLLAFMELYPFADVDAHNRADILKNAYTMTGGLVGIAIAYPLEKKYIRFDTKAVWWAQILKLVLGMLLLLAVKECFRAPLELILPPYPARTVRYSLIVITAVVLWPMTFPWFGKLGRKQERETA